MSKEELIEKIQQKRKDLTREIYYIIALFFSLDLIIFLLAPPNDLMYFVITLCIAPIPFCLACISKPFKEIQMAKNINILLMEKDCYKNSIYAALVKEYEVKVAESYKPLGKEVLLQEYTLIGNIIEFTDENVNYKAKVDAFHGDQGKRRIRFNILDEDYTCNLKKGQLINVEVYNT